MAPTVKEEGSTNHKCSTVTDSYRATLDGYQPNTIDNYVCLASLDETYIELMSSLVNLTRRLYQRI